MIASCNDSAIPEVELPVPDEEQIELIPPSANPEPPELVARYIELQMEIESKHGKQAEIDTVIEGIMLANELAAYNGPMGRVFQFIDADIEATEADSAGQSIEEIRDKLNQKIGKSHCPSCKSFSDCSQNCDDTRQSDDMWTGAWAVGEVVTCGGSAAAAAIKKKPGLHPLL